ncbi:hypothetical protein DQ04_07011040 [Trypanosoma grayi]|uniref:hypothetical protein n=1 Tax=Trypanosoma grayi TaxID=71804 RepID=UPI0004F44754|nr:hypothetical protein DQ04_07011040 [Trypanosoma grayi]KEG08513.1 hypothetical protein DQ04_07011040 [Trypanosoma grayi]
MATTLCLVCSRCEHPICSRDDLLMTAVAKGTTENAFVYNLEDLLNLEVSVPCYSGDEVAEVSVVVSEKILTAPLPPAARLLALEAVVESQRLQRPQQEVSPDAGGVAHAPGGSDRDTAHSGGTSFMSGDTTVDTGTVEEENDQSEANPTQPEQVSLNNSINEHVLRSLARFGGVKECRVDLICVKEDVQLGGLVLCTKDRSAGVPPAPPSSSSQGDAENSNTNDNAPHSRVPHSIVEAAHRPPPPTQWSTHPGNLVVEEAYIQVRRRTKTARCPWFEAYDCRGRLECSDCHLGLGFLFVRKTCESASPLTPTEDTVEYRSVAQADEGNVEGVHEPHQKRERKEDEGRCDGGGEHQQEQKSKDGGGADQYPDTFVGLELKKIRQREWGLRDFQKRYEQAKNLKTFRELFPEAEELESLYGRLTALRTQSELYNNLLRKHKEQNDVQSALLQSQKERIHTYEEKLRTMQQIIEAQRAQLEMQGRQIKHQEELVRNHKSQVVTQQHQIHVEQLLLSEQSRTIESQREQLTLIQTHLRARMMKEQLEERCGQLTTLLQQAEEQHQTQSSVLAAVTTPLQSRLRPTTPLMSHPTGVTGPASRDDEVVQLTDEDSTKREVDLQQYRANQSNVLPSLPVARIGGASGSGGNEIKSGAVECWSQRWAEKASPAAVTTSGEKVRPTNTSELSTAERTAAIMRRLAEERARRCAAAESSGPTSRSMKTPKVEDGVRTAGGVQVPSGESSNSSESNNACPHPSRREE